MIGEFFKERANLHGFYILIPSGPNYTTKNKPKKKKKPKENKSKADNRYLNISQG